MKPRNPFVKQFCISFIQIHLVKHRLIESKCIFSGEKSIFLEYFDEKLYNKFTEIR